MIPFIVGLMAVVATIFLMISERRGMYFRLFTRYYFTPRIAERMHIVKTGYDERGQIAILEGPGLDKSYALSCDRLPPQLTAGTGEVFVYRQKYPTKQNVYRYSAMETEMLAMGHRVENSVTVVKGAKRIESDEEWTSINFIVHVLSLILCALLILCAITAFLFIARGENSSVSFFAIYGVAVLILKLCFKTEKHGPALRIYADVAPATKSGDEVFTKVAELIGLDENERRAFLREQERREIFEKMNPRFNEFYRELRRLLAEPTTPTDKAGLLTAARAEMDRVCFSATAHPQTKSEAMLEKQRAEKVAAMAQLQADESCKKHAKAAGGVIGSHNERNGPANAMGSGSAELAQGYAKSSDGHKIPVEEVEDGHFNRNRSQEKVTAPEPIVIEDVKEAPTDSSKTPPTPAAISENRGEGGAPDRPPSKADYSEIHNGSKIVCSTCGGICQAPKEINWTKTRCPECRAMIKRIKVK